MKLFYTLLVPILFISCRSTKDIAFFNDIIADEQLNWVPFEVEDYKLQPHDNLYIDLQSSTPEINQQFQITDNNTASGYGNSIYNSEAGQYIHGYMLNSEGEISLPFLGALKLEGLTVEEATAVIQGKADEFLKEPTIKVKLLSFRITVLGEVHKPGVINNYDKSTTLLEAIARAGGTSDYADIKEVAVIRRVEEGTKTYLVDLTSKEILASDVYFLRPNDVIYIEPGNNKNVSLNAQALSIVFSTIATLMAVISFF